MPFTGAGLTPRERQMVDQLVIACGYLESMYWRQSDPDGLALYKALEHVETPLARNVRHYLFINGSRWDLVDENKPFVGTTPMPPGHALYPAGSHAREIEAYVAAHPGQEGRPSTTPTRSSAARAPTLSDARITTSSSRSSTARRRRCGRRRRSPTIRRSPSFCGCAPTRC